MKVTAPDDLQGRLISLEQRAALVWQALRAFAAGSTDLGPPSDDALDGLADIVEEMVDEIAAVRGAYVEESNKGVTR